MKPTPCECPQCTCEQITRRFDRICRVCDLQRLTLKALSITPENRKSPEEIINLIEKSLAEWSSK